MSQRSPGHAPVSSIAPECRCCADESGPNRGASVVPNAHRAAVPVPRRSATKLRSYRRAAAIASASSCVCSAGRSPCSTTIFETDSDTTRSAAAIALFSGSGWPFGVGSESTSAPSPAAAAAATSSGVITVMRLTEPTLAAAVSVSTSMANTTFSRVAAENTAASRGLAAARRLAARIKPTSPWASARLPLMCPSCQCRSPGDLHCRWATVNRRQLADIDGQEPRQTMASTTAVMGAGAWGTALAKLLAEAAGDVMLWARRSEVAAEINASRHNLEYLPGVQLPAGVRATGDADEALRGATTVLLAVPAQTMRTNVQQWAGLFAQRATL